MRSQGVNVDGQVLVLHDMLGMTHEFNPRFLRRYLNLYEDIEFLQVCILFLCCIITCFHSIGLNNLVYEKDVIKKPNFLTFLTPEF